MKGLIMDYPLTLTQFFERSRKVFHRKTMATRVPGVGLQRYTYADYADRVCRLGIARTWQLVRVFRRMSVLENVVCGALNRLTATYDARRFALRLIEFTGLSGKEHVLAGTLPLADKKRLELTRALATGPRLLLLDEAMSGLTPAEAAAAVDLVRLVHRDFRREFMRDALPLTVCLVEHVMEVVMPLSHRVLVLDYGKLIADGPPEQVVHNDLVIKAYLGAKYRAGSH